MENFILIHYILVNLRSFPWDFVIFENGSCKALYSCKMGFGVAPRRCEIRSKPQPLLQKKCLSYTFETLVRA